MEKITIEYSGTVFTPAGFRWVRMTATAERISEKRAKILEVLQINGEEVVADMSRTGANRQKFYGMVVANREVGKTKNLSACRIV